MCRWWREINQQVRRLAKRRGKLDVEEAALLLAARGAGVHLHLGMGSFEAYLEQVLGYGPRKTRERMRAAEALQELPRVRGLLEEGALSWSAVREVTRVATPETEQVWLEAIDGCNVREIEDAVSGRKRGDRPTDPSEPMPRRVRMELPPEVYAVFIEARRHLEREVGESMTDAAFMSMVCRGVLSGEVTAEPDVERVPSNVPPHQIALTVCVRLQARLASGRRAGGRGHAGGDRAIALRCDRAGARGWAGGGAGCEIDPAAHPQHGPGPRSSPLHGAGVPLVAVRRDPSHRVALAARRQPAAQFDHAVRRAPCRGPRRTVADHGLRRRARGASRRRPAVRHAAATAQPAGLDQALIADARSALTGLGFRPGEASAAVAKAVSHVGQEVTLEALIRAALQRCPRPANHGP